MKIEFEMKKAIEGFQILQSLYHPITVSKKSNFVRYSNGLIPKES